MARDGSDIGKTARPVIFRLWNAYSFFTLYANIDEVRGTLRPTAPTCWTATSWPRRARSI